MGLWLFSKKMGVLGLFWGDDEFAKVLRGYKNVTVIAIVILSFVLLVVVCLYMLVCFHVYLELVVLNISK